jgi:hypothetical protein
MQIQTGLTGLNRIPEKEKGSRENRANPVQPSSVPSLRLLRVLCVSQCLLLVSLAISLCLCIAEADRASTYSQQSYKNGLRDGESYTRAQLLRAKLEAQIIQDQQTQSAKNKL